MWTGVYPAMLIADTLKLNSDIALTGSETRQINKGKDKQE